MDANEHFQELYSYTWRLFFFSSSQNMIEEKLNFYNSASI